MKPIPTFNKIQTAILATFYAMASGAFYRIQWQRPLKIRKAYEGVRVTKTVSAVVKAGVEYDNKQSVIAKRASGDLPSVNNGLPWGTWFDYPRVIVHTPKGATKESYYLRFTPANEFGRMLITYHLTQGNETRICSRSEAMVYALKDEFRDIEMMGDAFTLRLDTLVSLERIPASDTKGTTPITPQWETTPEAFNARVNIAENI